MTNRYKVFAKMTTYLYVHVDADSEDDAIDIANNIDGGDFIPLNQGIVECGDWEITDAEIELDHHPDCPAVDGFGCRCSEIEEVSAWKRNWQTQQPLREDKHD